MIDVFSIFKDTKAYQAVLGDKINGRLSHAYLILSKDQKFLKDYLKVIAKILVCEENQPCLECRHCSLIENERHLDVLFYPTSQEKGINVDDVNSLIEQSYIRPIENSKKVFVLVDAQKMNAQAQNKLLKTLEEPPENVHIILGATSEFSLLPTILSRVKKLEVPPFSAQKIISALSQECLDIKKLERAVTVSDKTLGGALELYSDVNLDLTVELVKDLLINMKSSSDILTYSVKISSLSVSAEYFIGVLELYLRDMMVMVFGGESNDQESVLLNQTQNFSKGALIHALEKTTEALKRLTYNGNPVMVIEWLLFQILEGKYKWQKL